MLLHFVTAWQNGQSIRRSTSLDFIVENGTRVSAKPFSFPNKERCESIICRSKYQGRGGRQKANMPFAFNCDDPSSNPDIVHCFDLLQHCLKRTNIGRIKVISGRKTVHFELTLHGTDELLRHVAAGGLPRVVAVASGTEADGGAELGRVVDGFEGARGNAPVGVGDVFVWRNCYYGQCDRKVWIKSHPIFTEVAQKSSHKQLFLFKSTVFKIPKKLPNFWATLVRTFVNGKFSKYPNLVTLNMVNCEKLICRQLSASWWLNWNATERMFKILGGIPGLVVMGGDSCSKGCGFESQHWILNGHFSH